MEVSENHIINTTPHIYNRVREFMRKVYTERLDFEEPRIWILTIKHLQ